LDVSWRILDGLANLGAFFDEPEQTLEILDELFKNLEKP